MRALSLWQPWAILIALGAKKYETRHWTTSYRGPLVIHAPKKQNRELYNTARSEPFVSYLLADGYKKYSELPFGSYVCLVDLVDIILTEKIRGILGSDELAFGNYVSGRYAWKLENIRRFIKPIPARGHQGLWMPTPDEIILIEASDDNTNPTNSNQ